MAINSHLAYASRLMPDVTLERFQKTSQWTADSGTTASSTIGGAEQTGRESRDQVQLSLAARQAYAAATPPEEMPNSTSVSGNIDDTQRSHGSNDSNSVDDAAQSKAPSRDEPSSETRPIQLTEQEQQQILELSQRNQEVQVHEAAHAAVGGRYAGAPQLSYETGPDGKRYAVSGEVSIDVSEIKGDPEATMKKADIVYAAALAPAQPSAQDRLVAAKAAQMKTQARAELLAQNAAAATAMVERSHLPPAADTTAVPAPIIPSTFPSFSAYTATAVGPGKTPQPEFSSVI